MVNPTPITTVYVNPITGKDTHTGSRQSPLKTILQALKVSPPVIIQLAPGNYNSASGERFPLIIPDGVTVIGNETNKGGGIVISGSGEYQSPSFGVQNVTLLLLNNSSLRGVTVTNPVTKGTGVWIESTRPNIAHNTFTQCSREGVFISGTAKPVIIDNVFVQNAASGLFMARNSKGEVLRNVFQKQPLGIVLSDFAAPLVAHNKLTDNRTAIALSRNACPVLRQNLIVKNAQGGLLIKDNALPDLGNSQDAAGNIFNDNGEFDLQNTTSQPLISVGNQLNPTQVKGQVDFVSVTTDNPVQLANTKFIDLAGHWAGAFVEALVNKGIISGFPDGTFAPNSPITRAQYAALIAKTFNLPANNQLTQFKDVKSNFWAASAIKQAAQMGFISGFPDGTFRPGQNLTKVQAIVSVVNGLKLTGGSANVLSVYGDRAQIPSYATNAVATATAKKLVVNYPDTRYIEPLRDITRAEVASLIYQALVATGQEPAIASPYIIHPEVELPAFTDLNGHWAEPFIRGLANMGITHGFADGSYQPNQPMTRAQYAAMVAVAFNPTPKRPPINFTDVPQDFWAYQALQIAATGGFVSGFSDRTFRPQQNVQRLQVIVSLVNGLALPAVDSNRLLIYTDSNTIPEYARKAVATATQTRIVANYPNPQQLIPTRAATRAEVAVMVYQALVAIQQAPSINSPYIISTPGS
ncbi:S-layer homology domain-containing protein [Anabaena sp. 4-3]|uniref:S-layer homology domain-containing protein n=1 Tax=Anabaena sp. 4-3 TaxID=1811979 RepID=UPI00082E5596|nr:S-layer homology domain-containing protein [Anabaena sp. 4-3]